jgi:hypothetical protein
MTLSARYTPAVHSCDLGYRRDIQLVSAGCGDTAAGPPTVPDQHARRHSLPRYPEQLVPRYLRLRVSKTRAIPPLQHSWYYCHAPGLAGSAALRTELIACRLRALPG